LTILSPLHRASRQIAVFLESKTQEFALSGGESHVVAYLRSFGPCSIQELRRVFGYKKSTLTGMLDRLSAADIVTREVHPKDRRSFLVDLTTKGEQLARIVRDFCEDFERDVISRVTKGEFAGFQRVMHAIAAVTCVDVRETTTTNSHKGESES
jgi:DNA-binding MarR family transcriptional regulator